jgi:hypothetical protein
MKNNQLLRQFSNLCGFGERTGVHVPAGKARQFPRGSLRGFKIRKLALVLTAALVAPICLSPSLHAAVAPTFTASQQTVGPGGTVYVQITASGFTDLLGAGFSLSWNSGVLQYVGSVLNSQLAAAGTYIFNASGGNLGFLWSDDTSPPGSGTTLSSGGTVFTMQFTAIGGIGTSSTITFGDSPTERDVLFFDYTEISGPDVPTINGGVTVVPEPVNWALGLFACVFIGGATVRWASSRRMSLQPAQTASHGEPGA